VPQRNQLRSDGAGSGLVGGGGCAPWTAAMLGDMEVDVVVDFEVLEGDVVDVEIEVEGRGDNGADVERVKKGISNVDIRDRGISSG
jgi:hypothetical protein